MSEYKIAVRPTYCAIYKNRTGHEQPVILPEGAMEGMRTWESDELGDNLTMVTEEKEVATNTGREKSLYNLVNNAHNGVLSRSAKKKITYAINVLAEVVQKKEVFQKSKNRWFSVKMTFLTLTLPALQGDLKDTEITNKCLNQFLVELREYYGLNYYIWRAEVQENGNIHYHIALDSFIAWYDVRKIWNRQMRKVGLIDKFRRKHGHTDAPTENIRSIRHVKNVESYLMKYMGKEEKGKRPVTGRLWGCSQSLVASDLLTEDLLPELLDSARGLIRKFNCMYIDDDHFTCIFYDRELLNNNEIGEINQIWTSYVKHLKHLYPPQTGTFTFN